MNAEFQQYFRIASTEYHEPDKAGVLVTKCQVYRED